MGLFKPIIGLQTLGHELLHHLVMLQPQHACILTPQLWPSTDILWSHHGWWATCRCWRDLELHGKQPISDQPYNHNKLLGDFLRSMDMIITFAWEATGLKNLVFRAEATSIGVSFRKKSGAKKRKGLFEKRMSCMRERVEWGRSSWLVDGAIFVDI